MKDPGSSTCRNAILLIFLFAVSCGANHHSHALQAPTSATYGTLLTVASMHQMQLQLTRKSCFFASHYSEMLRFWRLRNRQCLNTITQLFNRSIKSAVSGAFKQLLQLVTLLWRLKFLILAAYFMSSTVGVSATDPDSDFLPDSGFIDPASYIEVSLDQLLLINTHAPMNLHSLSSSHARLYLYRMIQTLCISLRPFMLTHGAQIRLRKALDRPRRLVDLGRIAAAHPLSSNANLARIAVFQEKTEIKDRIFAVYKILILIAKLWTPSNSHPFNTLHSDLDHRRKSDILKMIIADIGRLTQGEIQLSDFGSFREPQAADRANLYRATLDQIACLGLLQRLAPSICLPTRAQVLCGMQSIQWKMPTIKVDTLVFAVHLEKTHASYFKDENVTSLPSYRRTLDDPFLRGSFPDKFVATQSDLALSSLNSYYFPDASPKDEPDSVETIEDILSINRI